MRASEQQRVGLPRVKSFRNDIGARLVAISLCLAAGYAHADGRRITVEDMVSRSEIGQSFITPDGRTFIYELIPGLDKAVNSGSLGWGERTASAKLMALDLDGHDSRPSELFAEKPDAGYWIGAVAPDGQSAAIYALDGGQLRAGVIALQTRQVRWFGFTPNVSALTTRPVWLNNHELIYPVVLQGQPSFVGRTEYARTLAARWKQTFDGKVASVSVFGSPSNTGDAPLPAPSGALVRVDATSGSVSQIASGSFFALRLSPDGRFLSAIREGRYVGAAATDKPTLLALRDLVVVDLRRTKDALTAACEPCYVSVGVRGSPEWSGDGSALFFSATKVASGKVAQFAYHPHSGKTEDLGTSSVEESVAQSAGMDNGLLIAASDGAMLILTGAPSKDKQYPQLGLSYERLVRVDQTGDRADVLKPSNSSVAILGDFTWGRTGEPSGEVRYVGLTVSRDQVVVQTEGAANRIDVKSGTVLTIERPDESARVLAMAARVPVVVFVENIGGATSISVTKDGANRPLFSISQEMSDLQPAPKKRISYVVDGATLTSCASLPPGWSPNVKFPMVVTVYPGIDNDCKPADFSLDYYPDAELFAGHGYVVLEIDTVPTDRDPKSKTRYKRYLADHDEWTVAPRVVASAVKAAEGDLNVDGGRVGIYGMSQGFYSTLITIDRISCFKAAVAVEGWSDRLSLYGESALSAMVDPEFGADFGTGGTVLQEAVLGGAPWQAPERYVQSTPIFRADRISTPLLLVNSDFDAFPMGQAEEMYTALHRLQRDTQLATYWGEGHGLTSPANTRDLWRRQFEWFDSHFAKSSGESACTPVE